MNAGTCRLVASEQLPDTTACKPVAAGKTLAVLDGAMPKLPGKPIATPEPAVTSGMALRAGPRRMRSALEMASTTASRAPCALRPAPCALRPARAVARCARE